MWTPVRKSDEEGRELQGLLEESTATRPEAVCVEELSEDWPPAQRKHLAVCKNCQEAAQDVFAMREIFKGVTSQAEQARPSLATRGMVAIRTRVRKRTLPVS